MKIGLSTKTTVTLICLILAAVAGSSIALVIAWQEKHRMDEVVSVNIGDVLSVAELDIALLKQKGLNAAYLMDEGNRRWLDDLDRLEPAFEKSLDSLERSAGTDEDRALFRRAHIAFDRYAEMRREVVSIYESGNAEAAVASYLGELSGAYFEAIAACDTRTEATSNAPSRTSVRKFAGSPPSWYPAARW